MANVRQLIETSIARRNLHFRATYLQLIVCVEHEENKTQITCDTQDRHCAWMVNWTMLYTVSWNECGVTELEASPLTVKTYLCHRYNKNVVI